MQLKQRFLKAVKSGELGRTDDDGVFVDLKEFKTFFNDLKSDYVNSFLPAATIEKGFSSMSHTKFVFRIKKGSYRVHPDALKELPTVEQTGVEQADALNKEHSSAIEALLFYTFLKK